MATYVAYAPTSIIEKAMFNFDAFPSIGINYNLDGLVRVSVSDSFSYSDYLDSNFASVLYTAGSTEIVWTSTAIENLQDVLETYSNFADLAFEWTGNYDTNTIGSDSTPNPEDVGRETNSDINITWIYRTSFLASGVSGAYTDNFYGYEGGAGDIFLNSAYLPSDGTFSLDDRARQILLHELGHSLGLSHPHLVYDPDSPTISADYGKTKDLGFQQLGFFHIQTEADMNKEYFTIMSYDDHPSFIGTHEFHAYTPMILDVIALQLAYGEGPGTHGAGNDTIESGTVGYRTYFDKGGVDTVDLALYAGFGGAYLNLGVTITGAPHLVGVGMSLYDARTTILVGGDPDHLRWFYGEYENALGSSMGDAIIGNKFGNAINGGGGSDFLYGYAGADVLRGSSGADQILGGNGKDTLGGGSGNDLFIFDNVVKNANADRITDFTVTADLIHLESAKFTGIGTDGTLAPGKYREGGNVDATGATAPGQRILYDTDSGKLYYDADGNGSSDKILIAILVGAPNISNADLKVI
jgi:serralysin